MDIAELIQEAMRAGLRLIPEGERPAYSWPQEGRTPLPAAARSSGRLLTALCSLAGRMVCNAAESSPTEGARKAAESGTEQPSPVEPVVLLPGHPLVAFDWNASNGYCPGRRIIRDGVQHKVETCSSRGSWLHVWVRSVLSRMLASDRCEGGRFRKTLQSVTLSIDTMIVAVRINRYGSKHDDDFARRDSQQRVANDGDCPAGGNYSGTTQPVYARRTHTDTAGRRQS